MKSIYIAFFGLFGIFSRYYLGLLIGQHFVRDFPLGTFFINLTGAFLIGIIYALAVERMILSSDLRIGIMVGFLGGFTTFSAYCIESFGLLERGEYLGALTYFGLSPLLGVVCTYGGVILGRGLLRAV